MSAALKLNTPIAHKESLTYLLEEKLEGAKVEFENDTFFVVQEHPVGKSVLGFGPTVTKAVSAAVEYWSG